MSLLTPTWLVGAIYTIKPTTLKSQGIKAVLTDLDNTLIAWDNPDGTPQLRDWLAAMQAAGIIVMVVSNNNEQRISHALRRLDLPHQARALKPLPVGINKAMSRLKLRPEECIMVGDQILTDMIAGNLARVRTVLVRPLVQTDQWYTRINRFFERFIMMGMRLRGRLEYKEDIDARR